MFAAIGLVYTQPDNIEAQLRSVEQFAIPVFKKAKGFKHIYALTDRQTGKGYSITIWNSEDDYRAFAASETADQLAAGMMQAGMPVPQWEFFEVAVHA